MINTLLAPFSIHRLSTLKASSPIRRYIAANLAANPRVNTPGGRLVAPKFFIVTSDGESVRFSPTAERAAEIQIELKTGNAAHHNRYARRIQAEDLNPIEHARLKALGAAA